MKYFFYIKYIQSIPLRKSIKTEVGEKIRLGDVIVFQLRRTDGISSDTTLYSASGNQ